MTNDDDINEAVSNYVNFAIEVLSETAQCRTDLFQLIGQGIDSSMQHLRSALAPEDSTSRKQQLDGLFVMITLHMLRELCLAADKEEKPVSDIVSEWKLRVETFQQQQHHGEFH